MTRSAEELSRFIVETALPYGPVVGLAALAEAITVLAVASDLPYEKFMELMRMMYARKQQRMEDQRGILEALGLMKPRTP